MGWVFLFIVFITEKHEDFDENWNLAEFLCHFYTDEGYFGNPILLESFKNVENVSYEVCMYTPQTSIPKHLKRARRLAASISTDKLDIKVKMYGMHILFDQLSKLSQKFVDVLEEYYSKCMQHYKRAMEEADEREISGNVIQFRYS